MILVGKLMPHLRNTEEYVDSDESEEGIESSDNEVKNCKKD